MEIAWLDTYVCELRIKHVDQYKVQKITQSCQIDYQKIVGGLKKFNFAE